MEAIGTDPRYPVTEGWPHLVEQLLHSIKEPVFGVGHSLGGYLNFLAGHGCDCAQGFLFSVPTDAAAISHLLRQHRHPGPVWPVGRVPLRMAY